VTGGVPGDAVAKQARQTGAHSIHVDADGKPTRQAAEVDFARDEGGRRGAWGAWARSGPGSARPASSSAGGRTARGACRRSRPTTSRRRRTSWHANTMAVPASSCSSRTAGAPGASTRFRRRTSRQTMPRSWSSCPRTTRSSGTCSRGRPRSHGGARRGSVALWLCCRAGSGGMDARHGCVWLGDRTFRAHDGWSSGAGERGGRAGRRSVDREFTPPPGEGPPLRGACSSGQPRRSVCHLPTARVCEIDAQPGRGRQRCT
jgi:hypothetical protein